MNHTKTSNLRWLDNLGMAVPGYAGYESRAHRRAAAFALRDAILHRLNAIRVELERARSACESHDAHAQAQSLDRIEGHVDRIRERVRGLGTRYESFYTAPDFDQEQINPVHGVDLLITRKAENTLQRFQHPDQSHNLLAALESDLSELEAMLDGRALMLQGLSNGVD